MMRFAAIKVKPDDEPRIAKREWTISQLKDHANKCHDEVISLAKDAIRAAKQAGDALNLVKDKIPHGEFMEWIKDNFKGSHKTATNYMRIARQWKKELAPYLKSPHFGYVDALHVLSLDTENKKWKPEPSKKSGKVPRYSPRAEAIDKLVLDFTTTLNTLPSKCIYEVDSVELMHHVRRVVIGDNRHLLVGGNRTPKRKKRSKVA